MDGATILFVVGVSAIIIIGIVRYIRYKGRRK